MSSTDSVQADGLGNRPRPLVLFLGYAVLVVFSFVYLYPFLIQLTTSFKTNADAVDNPLSLRG